MLVDIVEHAYLRLDDQYSGAAIDVGSAFQNLICTKDEISFGVSARSLLREYLSLNAKTNQRTQVLCMGYNCASVVEAIRRAGLVPRFIDFCDISGKIDWASVGRKINNDTLAIIIPHFFGIPYDFTEIIGMCKDSNVLIIEDSAHLISGKIKKHKTGAWSDATIYSFGLDKPINCFGGGAIRVKDQFLFEDSVLQASMEPLDEQFTFLINRYRNALSHSFKSDLYKKIYRRLMPKKVPPSPPSDTLFFHLLASQIANWQHTNTTRLANYWSLKNVSKHDSWFCSEDVEISPIKLKIRVVKDSTRQKIIRDAARAGIRLGNFNWNKAVSKDGECKVADIVAHEYIEVPIHENLNNQQIRYLMEIIS